MIKHWRCATTALLVTLMSAGCSAEPTADGIALGRESSGSGGVGDPGEGFATLRESRRVIVATMRSAARDLTADGAMVEYALGGVAVCASAPTEAAEYSAYARLGGGSSGSGSVESQLKEAADRMVAAGWRIEAERGSPDPAYRLSKGPEAAVGLGLDEREEGVSIRFAVKGPCLRVEGPGLSEFADKELDLG